MAGLLVFRTFTEEMLHALREYLEGAGDPSAPDIFEALLPQLTCGTKRRRLEEVKGLLQLLKAKDLSGIAEQCQTMLDVPPSGGGYGRMGGQRVHKK